MGERIPHSPETPSIKSLHSTLAGLLHAEGEYPENGDCHRLTRGEFVLDDYMDFVLKGHDPKNQVHSRRQRLESGRPILHISGIDRYTGGAVMIAYKADLNPAAGFDFLAEDTPDYERGSPDEEPFIYYTEKVKMLDDTAKERLLQDIADAFN